MSFLIRKIFDKPTAPHSHKVGVKPRSHMGEMTTVDGPPEMHTLTTKAVSAEQSTAGKRMIPAVTNICRVEENN